MVASILKSSIGRDSTIRENIKRLHQQITGASWSREMVPVYGTLFRFTDEDQSRINSKEGKLNIMELAEVTTHIAVGSSIVITMLRHLRRLLLGDEEPWAGVRNTLLATLQRDSAFSSVNTMPSNAFNRCTIHSCECCF